VDAPAPKLVQAWRCLRVALCLLVIALRAAFIYPRVGEAGRTALKRHGSLELLRALGITLDAASAAAPAGSLVVANHVSWLDIFVISAVRPGSFVSKSEVRRWPFIGWLAARNNTVFLSRGTRGHAKNVNVEIDARLNAGQDVVIFPEGTTTDGTRLLSFHSALLQPAIETGHPILPLALSYRDRHGRLSTAPAFAGDTSLPQCFAAILASRSLKVCVRPCAAIASSGKARREVSEEARAAILATLAAVDGFIPPASA